jgi:ketosteroid isomerase-like protein
MMRMSLVVFTVMLTAPLASARDDKADKAADVKKVDRVLTEAHIKRDAKEVDRLTSEDFVHVSPHGKTFTKKQILDGLADDRLVFEKIDDSEVTAAIYGDTAVMTGLSRMKGRSKSRGEFDEDYRWTRVYVRRDGKWQIVAEQMGRYIPDDKRK